MVSGEAIVNVVGIIGNVISLCLFLSPVPTFLRIVKKKDVEEFQFYPYIATLPYCILRLFYAMPFVTQHNNTLAGTVNAVGLVLELIYLAVFCVYDNDKQNKRRRRVAIGLGLAGEVVFAAIIVAITMLGFRKLSHRAIFVGLICDFLNAIMLASPLLIWNTVIRTKSVEYMPLFLSVASLANGCIWLAYACGCIFIAGRPYWFLFDTYVIGVTSGIAQLYLYGRYCTSSPKHGSPAADIHLQKRVDVV